MTPLWVGLGAVVAAQIAYPLMPSDGLVIATVLCGFALSVAHAWRSRGPATAARLVAVAGFGGWLAEAVGVATGFPFGQYEYVDLLGPRLAGVPLVIPLAWVWMAWPSWIVAGRLVGGWGRIPVAAWALASWDLFLDPLMVDAGYWRWAGGTIPLTNYLGWFGVALVMMVILRDRSPESTQDAVMIALYLWTYASSVLGHAVFFGLPRSAVVGGLGMGLVAIPLAVRLMVRR